MHAFAAYTDHWHDFAIFAVYILFRYPNVNYPKIGRKGVALQAISKSRQ